VSSDRTLFGKSKDNAISICFFSKKPEVDSLETTIAGFPTPEYCFAHISTLLSVHQSRMSTKVELEKKFMDKVPGAKHLFSFGSKPTAHNQQMITSDLYNLTHSNLDLPFRERLVDFTLAWDKQKFLLMSACDLDMPFSDDAKRGKMLVSRIDKILKKIDSFIAIQISKVVSDTPEIDGVTPHTPPGEPSTPPKDGSKPPAYDVLHLSHSFQPARRMTK
jgi:hypothetical protein